MSSELIQNCTVPVGFEIVIGNTDVAMGKIWNMWFNVTGSDDPRKWDAENLGDQFHAEPSRRTLGRTSVDPSAHGRVLSLSSVISEQH